MSDAGLEREIQGDIGAEDPVARVEDAERVGAGWSDTYLQAAVRHAYQLGVADTLEAVTMSLNELRADPVALRRAGRAEILARTHGLLAPGVGE